MNDFLLSFILGIVEGLTEFLPVSSTAHLRISESLLGVNLEDGYWKMFTIVIQLGAILTLPLYFRNRLLRFIVTFPKGSMGDRSAMTHPITLTLIAFVFTAGPSWALTKVIGKNLENLVLMGTALIVGGIVMWVVDSLYGSFHAGATEYEAAAEIEEMGIGRAIWIGLCQILSALFPGTSRSMVTIAGGQVAGLSRTAALEFSFLLSIPTMTAATAYDFLKFMHPGHGEASTAPHLGFHGVLVLMVGFVVSFFVAYAVVAWFMNWVRKHGFVPFAVYRLLAGAAVIVWALKR